VSGNVTIDAWLFTGKTVWVVCQQSPGWFTAEGILCWLLESQKQETIKSRFAIFLQISHHLLLQPWQEKMHQLVGSF